MSQTLSAFGICTADTVAVIDAAHNGGNGASTDLVGHPIRIILGHTRTNGGTRALENLFGIAGDRDTSRGFAASPNAFCTALAQGYSDDAQTLARSYDDNLAEKEDAGYNGNAGVYAFAGLAAAVRVLQGSGFTFFLD